MGSDHSEPDDSSAWVARVAPATEDVSQVRHRLIHAMKSGMEAKKADAAPDWIKAVLRAEDITGPLAETIATEMARAATNFKELSSNASAADETFWESPAFERLTLLLNQRQVPQIKQCHIRGGICQRVNFELRTTSIKKLADPTGTPGNGGQER